MLMGKVTRDIEDVLRILLITGKGGEIISIAEHTTPHCSAVGTGKTAASFSITQATQQLINEDNE
jgi:hypothetical protein